MGDVDNGSSLGLPVSRRSRSFENLSVESGGSLHERDDIQGHLRAEEVDSMLLRNDSGIESALSYAKAWSKYTKDVVAWVEKKLSLEVECAKNLAKMAETAKAVVGPQDYMPFQSIFLNAFQNDIENNQLWQQTAAALQSNKFVQVRLQKMAKIFLFWEEKMSWIDKGKKSRIFGSENRKKWLQELEASLRKAKLLYTQRQDEYEKAKSCTARAEEEHLSSSGSFAKDVSKQLEKKRRLEEEALQKAEEANEYYKASMAEVEEKRTDLESFKSDVLTQLRELIYQCDLTLKAVTVNLFQLHHAQVVSLPVNCQSLCESAKLYDPGQQYSEFVKSLPKEGVRIEPGSFETQSSQIDGVFNKQPASIHTSHGNLSQCSGDFPTQMLDDVGSPIYHRSQRIGEKRSSSSTDIQVIRGPPPFRSWSVGNQSGGMCSDSESAGGSSESRSMDSPSASPGDFKRRLPRTPSTGTMSSADDLDEREPPSPSDCGNVASIPEFPRRWLLLCRSAFPRVRVASTNDISYGIRLCQTMYIFPSPPLQCSLACHKKCLETLAIQCGHKKLHGRLHLFGVEFAQAAKSVPDGIPFIIKKCTSEIESRALNVKGIYRVNGAKSRVEKLCQAFENGKDLVELSELYAHDISNVLKLYLRQLPEPLILFRLYNEFIGLAKESQSVNEELDAKQASPKSKKRQSICIELNRIIIKIKDLLKQLPVPNYNTLQYLIGHLHRVTEQSDENKMSASNLGIIFGPTLIRPRQTDATVSLSSLVDYPYQARVVELLITYYEKIFDVSLQPFLSTSQSEENAITVRVALSSEEEREPQQQRKSFLAVKEGVLIAASENRTSETTALFLESNNSKNTKEQGDTSVTEHVSLQLGGTKSEGSGKSNSLTESSAADILDIHISAQKEQGNDVNPSLEKDNHSFVSPGEESCKVNLIPAKPNRQITKVPLRVPRTKPTIRPVSLPVDRILPPCVLNERNSRNAGAASPEKLGRSPTIEEVSEVKALPAVNTSCRLSCWDTQMLQKNWDKQYKQYDITARTAMIVTNAPQEYKALESGTAGALSSSCSNNSANAILPSKPYSLSVRSGRTAADGNGPDAHPLAAFRVPRTLQPPPGTFYKPPSNKSTQSEKSSVEQAKACAPASASSVLQQNTVKLARSSALPSANPGQSTNEQKTGSEDTHSTDLKPTYQRLRPKRIQELEHREAHFV
ncbi:UNVERIFIED_CONTAM: hypothetical protein H355_004390 [Colinus virginianus]|nr:hypothetical protein H355_004390 [Colinus virginianus]